MFLLSLFSEPLQSTAEALPEDLEVRVQSFTGDPSGMLAARLLDLFESFDPSEIPVGHP
jgi:hypothetical protein